MEMDISTTVPVDQMNLPSFKDVICAIVNTFPDGGVKCLPGGGVEGMPGHGVQGLPGSGV